MENTERDAKWIFNYYCRRIAGLIGPEAEHRVLFFQIHGYFPRFKNPRTFSEKVCHRKLFNPAPNSATLADKYAVREHVARRGHESILNEIYLVTSDPQDIDLSCLPDKFVVKATHGSGWNLFVSDKQQVQRDQIIEACQNWMGRVHGTGYMEKHYSDIEPRIIIEELLEDDQHGIPLDYKFFVFHGKCQFIQVDYGRFTEHTRTIYDRNWNPQKFSINYPMKKVEDRPRTFDAMMQIAEDLARGMDFARVDLYSVNDKDIYFGEITLTPGGGLEPFRPRRGDFLMGAPW